MSEAFITRFEEFIEESGRQFWSCADQWEMLTARVMNLDKREVLVKAYNAPALDIRTPDVEILPIFRRRKTARQRKIEQRRRESQINRKTDEPIETTILPPEPKDNDSFWEDQ